MDVAAETLVDNYMGLPTRQKLPTPVLRMEQLAPQPI